MLLAVLLPYARGGIRFARESAAGRIGTGMLLGMIGLALVWLSQVPFRLAEVWWDRRYDQTDSGYLETLFGELDRARRRVPVRLLRARDRDGARRARRGAGGSPPPRSSSASPRSSPSSRPYLSVTEPLDDPELAADARAYAEKQGIEPIGSRSRT